MAQHGRVGGGGGAEAGNVRDVRRRVWQDEAHCGLPGPKTEGGERRSRPRHLEGHHDQ